VGRFWKAPNAERSPVKDRLYDPDFIDARQIKE
jgi:hypothetical protein